MRKIVIAYITPCNYCPFKVKTGRLRDTVPARTCAQGKYQIYCPGGAFDVSPHQAINDNTYIYYNTYLLGCVPLHLLVYQIPSRHGVIENIQYKIEYQYTFTGTPKLHGVL